MKNIIFNFQVHQPMRLNDYHFFEIGNHKNYFNKKQNAAILKRVVEKSYLPANRILLELIKKYNDRIKVSFSISGTAIDQFELYAPEIIESFQELTATGNVELLGQPYYQSLASLKSQSAFRSEVEAHSKKIWELFGQRPKIFANTGLIYSDHLGKMIANMGFQAALIEGIPTLPNGGNGHVLYQNPLKKQFKLLLREAALSDDISLRFSQTNWDRWPLTAPKYLSWLKQLPATDNLVCLSMDYATFGEHHKMNTGIFDFFKYLFQSIGKEKKLQLGAPSKVVADLLPHGPLSVPEPISLYGEAKDLSVWLGNEMQREAMDLIYELGDLVEEQNNQELLKHWKYLQSSDHFHYMNTLSEDGSNDLSPFDGPYEAFLRYMNVMSDLKLRLIEEHQG
ncbi:MAG: glycoside hydrolase family 57 protein, partial [Cyclobacteriaceae bacterium]